MFFHFDNNILLIRHCSKTINMLPLIKVPFLFIRMASSIITWGIPLEKYSHVGPTSLGAYLRTLKMMISMHVATLLDYVPGGFRLRSPLNLFKQENDRVQSF